MSVIAAPASVNAHPRDDPDRPRIRDYLSYSALSTYQRCPLRYYFQYVVQLLPAYKASSLIFGGALHTAIEHYYRQILSGAEPPGVVNLTTPFDQAWRDEQTLPIRYGKGESAQSLRTLATNMLTVFLNSDVRHVDGTILGIEEEFRRSVIPDCPDLLGRIDLLTLQRDVLHIIDFKSSRSRWGNSQIAEALPQMHMYATLLQPTARALGVRQIQLEWIVLTKTKQPAITRHTVTADARQVHRTLAVVRCLWDAIQAGHFYPAPSTQKCTTCPYAETCRAWEGCHD